MQIMNKVVFAFTLCILFGAALSSFTELEYRREFTQWMHTHDKVYQVGDFETRYSIFKYNMDFVDSWNADPTHTHTVELNKFADLSLDEYKKIYLGSHFDGTERLAKAQAEGLQTFEPQGDNINWAAQGYVTPPKDQGQCGSCWAFSTTGSVEALNFKYTRNLISLSEQNLVDCTGSFGNQGCGGGWMDSAFKYIIANKGIDREENYPYQAANGACRFSYSYVGATMNSYSDVQGGNEGALQNAVNGQPVSVAIDAGHTSFQLYKSGIYFEPQCSSSSLDHGVLVVGYGSENGDYYIVKNSWGQNWGMQGYLWMSRNRNNNCGIATSASFPLP